MQSIVVRKEVQEFLQASESLLSPASLTSDLTREECDLIAEYVMSLSHAKHPWSRSLIMKYT